MAYGTEFFLETTKYNPHSPYSASKASSDHFVRAYHDTYGMPTLVTNCSNNYGPYQFPEKLIPLFINNIRHGKPLPVYGKGENVRDWLFVEDHARAIDLIFHKGKPGDTYNIGGFNEWKYRQGPGRHRRSALQARQRPSAPPSRGPRAPLPPAAAL